MDAVNQQRGTPPVVAWAVAGVATLALIVYLVIAWVASGDAAPTPTGADDVPGWIHAVGIAAQIVNPCLALTAVGLLVVRPLVRRQPIGFDGLLILATATVYWQDPLVNYAVPFASYNADLVNLGSWAMHIPGWQSPNGNRFPEPLLFAGPVFVVVFLAGAMFANAVMRRAQARWSRIGPIETVLVGFLAIMVLSLAVEPVFVRLGLYHYGGAPGPAISAGRWYRFPLLEIPLMAVFWTFVAALRHFRDAEGRSAPERGAHRLAIGPRAQTLVRWLSLVGAVNLAFLGFYNLPAQVIAVNSGPWIADIQSRSYFMGGLCGPGTTYACPSPGVPIPRRHSSHVAPDGRLVAAP